MRTHLRLTLAIALLCATLFTTSGAHNCQSDLAQLVELMTGSFSSAAQAAADEDYFDISLHMAPVWLERSDAHWLYVEQALSARQEAPYRQRVYKVTQHSDGSLYSAVYELPEPEKHIGAWKDELPLAGITPDDLIEREGCTVVLCKVSCDTFSGSTMGDSCVSTLYGAAYATSEVTITPAQVISWDRGFDAEGNHIWGAENGPYVFDRVEPVGYGESVF